MKKVETKFLGKAVTSGGELDIIDAGIMGLVVLRCTEFTSLCPVTEQPDFGEITIAYAPRLGRIVETKSLKLYLRKFRDETSFIEKVTQRIASEINEALAPEWLVVMGSFKVRGGIAPTAISLFGGSPPDFIWGQLP